MTRAQHIIDRMFLSETPAPAVAPTPTKTPTRTPTTPPSPSKPRPGTRPWQPTKRPDVAPAPKARKRYPANFAEADQSPVSVPPSSDTPGDAGGPQPEPLSSPCDLIRPGDRVTIMSRHGSRLSGRASMRDRQTGGWTLDMGGGPGTPGRANDENIIAISRGGKRVYGRI
jgi:hypothetical protein